MPIGNGFFISPAGEVIPVNEHFEYVQQNPQKFGISPSQAKRWNWQSDRDRILGRILSEGWIRVRIPQPGSFHIDTWVLDPSTLQRIDTFLQEDEPWPNDRMWVSQISTGDRYEITVGQFESDQFRQHVAVRIEAPCRVCGFVRRDEMKTIRGQIVVASKCRCTSRHVDALYAKRDQVLKDVLARFTHGD